MPDSFIDWCYRMVEEVMAHHGYPRDREDDEPEQEIPLLKMAA
jgi:hypothetical protein